MKKTYTTPTTLVKGEVTSATTHPGSGNVEDSIPGLSMDVSSAYYL